MYLPEVAVLLPVKKTLSVLSLLFKINKNKICGSLHSEGSPYIDFHNHLHMNVTFGNKFQTVSTRPDQMALAHFTFVDR